MAQPGGAGKKAVLLLSGGLDSTTTLAIARSEGFAVYALTFRYGQRHEHEIEAACRVAAAQGVAQHVITTIDLRLFGGSALTADVAVPKDRPFDELEHGIPVTYVPARNTIFLSFALAWAEVLACSDIFIGVNALDYSGYPDCRPEYIAAYARMANLATKAGVEGGHPHAADCTEQGADHPARASARSRLRIDDHMLRPRPLRRRLWPLRRLPAAAQRLCRGRRPRPGPL